jgi:phosphatidate cytidylyltransferase
MMGDVALATQFAQTLGVTVLGGASLIAILRRFANRGRSHAGEAESQAEGTTLGTPQGSHSTPTILRTPLWLRLGTLLLLAVAVFVPAFLGGFFWLLLVCTLVLLGLLEFWSALRRLDVAPHSRVGSLVGLLLPVAAFFGGAAGLGAAAVGGFSVLAATALFSRSDVSLVSRLGGSWLGVCYVGLLGAYLVLLERLGGFGALIWFLMVVQLADVGGLMAGIVGGRHKLIPRLSPAKSWEGLLGSIVAAIFASWAFAFALPQLSWPWQALMALLLALTGLVGDLLASGFKRAAGLKDFGRILPGHGGVLDRFDGYLYTAPIFWMFLVVLTR